MSLKRSCNRPLLLKNDNSIDRNQCRDGVCNWFRNRFVSKDYLPKSRMVINDFRILQTVDDTILEVLSL